MAACDGLIGTRRARETDARELAQVHIAAWRAAYRDLLPHDYLASLSVDAREQAWRERLTLLAANRRPWVATADGQIVGFASAGPERDDDDNLSNDVGEVYAINVLPDCWHKGVGRNLMRHAERELREHRYSEAILWCLTDNARARAFYERLGWHFDGTTKVRDFGGADIEEVRYRKALE